MVVEEADGRYITNSGMLAQLKMLADAMYRGYWARDAFKYRSLGEEEEEVRNSCAVKRFRMLHGRATTNKARCFVELNGALESLEDVAANMMEFVVIMGGCDRIMLRRPYDAYLYNDNIMFGRHVEKQKLLNFLLQHDSLGGAPAVLPIIGAPSVGKRTLVAHVCKDERVSEHFSSVVHLNGDSFRGIANHDSLMSGKRILLIVEIVSNADEEDWAKFCSSMASMDRGSKVIILSRLKNSEKLRTVKPIFLNTFSYEEFSYLFKTLTFGSTDPAECPRLTRIADELARELQCEWCLVAANLVADVMRRNLNVRFWREMLSRLRRVAERNFSMFGEHPRILVQSRQQVDMTGFMMHPAAPLRILPCVSGSSRTELVPRRKELPKVRLGDLLVDPGVRPKGEFNVLTWDSRLPPYTSFVHFVPSCAPDVVQDAHRPQLGRKRLIA